MKRYLSLWLPRLPLQTRVRRRGERLPDEPFALTESGVHGLVLLEANKAARAAGLHAGLKFTDAKARVPELITEEGDREADACALLRLGEWLERFSPRVALDGADGLMLEITGCAHLYGGEDGMARALDERLRANGYTQRIGIAASVGAAHALARRGSERIVIIPEAQQGQGLETALAPLPVKALRISEGASTLLRRFGLTRIGQLYGIERKALARRFQSRDVADQVGLRLDQALGRVAEPLVVLRPEPEYRVILPCPEPLADSTGLGEALRILSEQLAAELERAGQGARLFRLAAFLSDGRVSSVSVTAARAVRAAAHMQRLLHERIERIDPGFGIDFVVLEAERTQAISVGSGALPGGLAGGGRDDVALAALADRLTAKLGAGAVTVAAPAQSHVPEAGEQRAVYQGALPLPVMRTETGTRPERIFERPERVDVLAEVPDGPPLRFLWRRVQRTVTRADGPERIAPEWWTHMAGQALPRARDYYRVEDREGRRYWLFREGLYEDGRGGPPDWFVHGLFA